MDEQTRELDWLWESRRALLRDVVCVVAGAGCLVALAPEVASGSKDLVSTFGIAFAGYSGMVVHCVAQAGTTLERTCPRCAHAFFGGLAASWRALPLPATACAHCGMALKRSSLGAGVREPLA